MNRRCSKSRPPAHWSVLQIMLKRYPSMRKWVYKGKELLPLIWFFVNDPEWRNKLTPDQLEKPLKRR